MINIIQSGTFSLLYVLFPTKKVGDGCRGEGVNQNNSNWGGDKLLVLMILYLCTVLSYHFLLFFRLKSGAQMLAVARA